ncbi:MAG: hypothetical protein OS130_06250 [Thermodesulfobacteriota bacterium]|jgi:hypothetical protein|nr:MAG: hypothetical protein OS130_06250 [Thermodesulfobacteriota bacterium]
MGKLMFFKRKKSSREEEFLFKALFLSVDPGSGERNQLRNSFFALDEEWLWQLALNTKVTAVFGHRLAPWAGRISHIGGENFMTPWPGFL